ncbi:sugar transporter [Aspergillus piperis CBS 112811]|uniref:Sugar transporter n=1 Tax=Aspergillus piperis CBS 112811 TaxID=1448313 RepID=A0A8G1VMP2_9EURO|nr:sugar transporter [Aspergillus piperis CBS 112811]RAH57727.1 sugar transporter [Aspergillus piperis CBS 112811]
MLFGYDQGVMGSLLTGPSFEATFPSISNGNSTLQGFAVAVYELGCAAGALTVIFSGDKFGRRLTVMVGELIIIFGAILQASSFSLAQLIVGRIVAGFGNGMAAAILPTWNGECSRSKNRGRAVMWQLNINLFGIALAYWVDYGLAASSLTSNNGWAWRLPLGLQSAFSAVTIVLALFLPESPRVLMRNGKVDEARDVVDMLSLEEDPATRASEVCTVVSLIENALQEDSQSDSQWQAIFTQGRPRFFQRLILSAFVMCMYQLTGVNLITYYVHLSLLMSGFVGLEFWIASFIPIPLIDRLGRRPLLLFGAVGQCVSMAVLAATVAYPGNKACGYVSVVCVFIFNTVCAIGTNGLAFLLPVELTPLQTRGTSVAISTGFFWLCNFFVVMISPVLISRIQYGTYILWASFLRRTLQIEIPEFEPSVNNLDTAVPETCKASLEDIDVLFENNPKWPIGPQSKKKMAKITEDASALTDAVLHGRKESAPTVDMVENASSI